MVGIWVAAGFLAVATFVTYTRVPLAQLYHVSRGGLVGGASREVTYLNYPVALLAIALLGFVVARLFSGPYALSRVGRWAAGIAAALSLGLCLVAMWPGVVNDANLDARPVNALPALGVVIAIGLTVLTVRRAGLGPRHVWTVADWALIGTVVVMAALALPWILADLGVYVGDVPLLGHVFMSKQILTGDPLAAVHLGDHHGLDGMLFAAPALFLMRPLAHVRWTWLRVPLAFYLALMLAYGLANAGNDWSLEQLVKRGWIVHELPSVAKPALTPAWGVILLATVVIGTALLLLTRPRRRVEA